MAFEIWAEKYRPKMLDEVIGQKHIMKRLKGFVEKKTIPHMLFAGPAGCGKTTAAICMAHELYGTGWKRNYLELNASVTPDTPILIEKNKEIKRTTFKELDKEYFSSSEQTYAKVNDLKVLSIKNNKVKFFPVGLISRHRVGKVAEIKYEGGKVTTSLNHSIIIISDKGGLASKKTEELKEGDLLLTFKTKVDGEGAFLNLEKFKPNLFNNLKSGKIKNPKIKNAFKNKKLDEDLAWLLGLYLAEGCTSLQDGTKGQTIFTLGYPQELNIAKKIRNIVKNSFYLNCSFMLGRSGFDRERLSSVQVRILNTQLTKFFKDNFYEKDKPQLAATKRTPPFIFNSDLDNRLSFLKGYMGDATGEWDDFVRYSSRSKENLIDIAWLARISNLESSIFKDEARIVWKRPAFSYVRTNLLPAEPFIRFFERLGEKIRFNWRYGLRHQLYHKKSARIDKKTLHDMLKKVDKEKLASEEKEVFDNLKKLIESDLSAVKITKIKIRNYSDFVYDVSVPDCEMFWGGTLPILLHNSDERGISVIRLKVKDFARTRPIGANYKIICLDEADALTQEAQQALRRTMENYTSSCRFILVCNYSSHIIEPIQSRCAVFRFRSHTKEDVIEYLKRIAESEKLDVDGSGYDAILELSGGDLRKASNLLQTASMEEKIDEKTIYDVAAQAAPADVKKMMEEALAKNFIESRKSLQDLLFKQGISGEDIIREISKQVYNLQLSDKEKIELIEKIGECEFRLDQGANEQIQLEALLAKFAMFGK